MSLNWWRNFLPNLGTEHYALIAIIVIILRPQIPPAQSGDGVLRIHSDNICSSKGCKEKCTSSTLFCLEHEQKQPKCITHGCSNKKVSERTPYCWLHACTRKNCSTPSLYGMAFCWKHTAVCIKCYRGCKIPGKFYCLECKSSF